MTGRSSIIYQNSQQSVFLIDIPSSIEIAQTAFPNSSSSVCDAENIESAIQNHHHRQIFSLKPLEYPYSSAPEPKSEAARARLLSRIPESEISFHESISSIVRNGIDEIRQKLGETKWCGPRRVSSGAIDGRIMNEQDAISEPARKKRKSDLSAEYACKLEIEPPLILSPSCVNDFTGLADLHGIQIKNPSPLEAATLQVKETTTGTTTRYTIPPASYFIIGNLSASQSYSEFNASPIPGLPPTEKFNMILFDPPWPNRSVRRSSQYLTHGYLEMDSLVAIMQQIILSHLNFGDENTMVGIWTTNNAKSRQAAYDAFANTGLEIGEIWIWIKTTENGELVSPLDGLWRKPYEVLFLGRPKKNIEKAHKEPIKRVIAAVPDEHSRKPNLKEILELLFFRDQGNEARYTPMNIKQYTALEVFARNLTAGWCACGNDVLKFNADQWWYQPRYNI